MTYAAYYVLKELFPGHGEELKTELARLKKHYKVPEEDPAALNRGRNQH